MKKYNLLLLILFFSCGFDLSKQTFVFERRNSIQYFQRIESSRIRIIDSAYQKYIFRNTASFRIFFLNFIPEPNFAPNSEWLNFLMRIPISADEDFLKSYENKFIIEDYHDRFATLVFTPSSYFKATDFEDISIFIFLMFDSRSRNFTRNTSWIGLPLDVEIRVSIFKNKNEMAICQIPVKRYTFTNKFLDQQFSDSESFLSHLSVSNKIDFDKNKENIIFKEINECLDKLEITTKIETNNTLQ